MFSRDLHNNGHAFVNTTFYSGKIKSSLSKSIAFYRKCVAIHGPFHKPRCYGYFLVQILVSIMRSAFVKSVKTLVTLNNLNCLNFEANLCTSSTMKSRDLKKSVGLPMI